MKKNNVISDEKVAQLMGFKHYRNYKYSNTKKQLDVLIDVIVNKCNEIHKKEIENLKKDVIDYVKSF